MFRRRASPAHGLLTAGLYGQALRPAPEIEAMLFNSYQFIFLFLPIAPVGISYWAGLAIWRPPSGK
jgi:hypothetical protein